MVPPSTHPPYENPIDGRFPLHFDPTLQFGDYVNGIEIGLDQSIEQILQEYISGIVLLLTVEFELRTCVTPAARATCPPGYDPEESPPFFVVFMFGEQSHRWSEIYRGARGVLEKEFPRERFEEYWPLGKLIIRFGLHGNDALF